MNMGHENAGVGDTTSESSAQRGVSRRTIMKGAAWTVPALMVTTAAPAFAASAQCAGGALYNSQSRGRLLSGALGTLNLDAVAAFLGVHAAAWDPTKNPFTAYPGSPGPATSPTYFDTQLRNIDVSVLNGAITAGIGLSLDAGAPIGTYKEYAYAERDGHEIGASGLITDSGAINLVGGNSGEPKLGTLSLRTVLQNVTNPGGTTGTALTNLLTNITDLDLIMGAMAGRAEQIACQLGVSRTYLISYLRLIAKSALIGNLVTQLTKKTTVDAVNAAVNTALQALGALSTVLGGLVTANASLAIGVVTGDTPPQPNALSLNLGAGTATLDIGTLVGGLNSKAPNTRLFVDAPILNSVGAATLVNQWATNSLTSAVTVSGDIALTVALVNVATIHIASGTTLSQLAAGQGITVTGASAGLVTPILGLVASTIATTVKNTLLGINTVTNALNAIQTGLLNPLFTVLQFVILLAVNLENGQPAGWTLPADFSSLPGDGANTNIKGQYDVAALHVGLVSGIVTSAAYPVVNLHVGRGSVGQTYKR